MNELTVLPNILPKRMKAAPRILLGLVPFTPVEFIGKDAWLAYSRIAGYGVLAYFTYNKMRPLSYIFMASAGTALISSLTAGYWKEAE